MRVIEFTANDPSVSRQCWRSPVVYSSENLSIYNIVELSQPKIALLIFVNLIYLNNI